MTLWLVYFTLEIKSLRPILKVIKKVKKKLKDPQYYDIVNATNFFEKYNEILNTGRS